MSGQNLLFQQIHVLVTHVLFNTPNTRANNWLRGFALALPSRVALTLRRPTRGETWGIHRAEEPHADAAFRARLWKQCWHPGALPILGSKKAAVEGVRCRMTKQV